mgnify:CR=1 FL=1
MRDEEKLNYMYKKILRDQKKVDEAGAIVIMCLLGGFTCVILALLSQ